MGSHFWKIQEDFFITSQENGKMKIIRQWAHRTRLHIICHDSLVIATMTWFLEFMGKRLVFNLLNICDPCKM
jgi:hypothetical protein